MKNINLQIQEVQRIPSRKNSRISTLIHIIVKLLKDKTNEKFLKAATENLLEKETKITINSSLFTKNNGNQRLWDDTLKVITE